MRLSRRDVWVLGGMAALGGAVYLLVSWYVFGIGFPLDDAWIHQTYARNLAQLGQWAFVPGKISAGSTAPLWSFLLAIGHLIPGNFFYVWTYGMGVLVLWGTAVLVELWARNLNERWQPRWPWIGLLVVGEWHLVWASVSGMETVLAALVVAAVFVAIQKRRWWLAGGLAGIGVWVRPDMLTLLGPIALALWMSQVGWGGKRRGFFGGVLGFGMFFVPYLAFNQWLAGEVWPNTFYAKQAEYAVLLQEPLLVRLGRLLTLPLVGTGALLLPGVVMFGWQAVRERCVDMMGALLWWGGYTVLYALRLPVVYQHGRYLMPAMPIFWVAGVLGTFALLRALPLVQKWRRRATMFVGLSIGLVNAAFWGLGAWTYGQDVAIIETEMVAAARWIHENTPSDSLIAAHDIGALGYFGGREIVDLAGLVSPEVIPFIRDEKELDLYLQQVGAEYLMTFPGWYPHLTMGRRAVFITGAMFAPRQGGENMAIYVLKE